MANSRDELVHQVLAAGRQLTAAAVTLHSAVADMQGLSPVEEKALELLENSGALTPGELSRHCGLAPASITGLINRLEEKGFARRTPHPQDRRRLLVEINRDRLHGAAVLLEDYVRMVVDLCADYDDDQLRAIAAFTEEVARRKREAAGRLTR
ncbi:MarR family winged helix-turn-helix transcriptional regulator [Allokutzneria oryzae]|uniref:MarR family winged helix-turn-helix transcriptional regulator n=1 Tax=Allokutzneria oryzae TaxID=1378989 RepID=A0ABV6A559_9PSEU